MNVILVGAECAPWSKTGKLHDMAYALPMSTTNDGTGSMLDNSGLHVARGLMLPQQQDN